MMAKSNHHSAVVALWLTTYFFLLSLSLSLAMDESSPNTPRDEFAVDLDPRSLATMTDNFDEVC